MDRTLQGCVRWSLSRVCRLSSSSLVSIHCIIIVNLIIFHVTKSFLMLV